MFQNIDLLNGLIVGRVEPHIYAFTTDTIPNYLKIGDTYRPVSVRLNEWRKHFPDLQEIYQEKATIAPDIFFRDYSIHQFLEAEQNKIRLLPSDIQNIYYSNEFFRDTSTSDIQAAIQDIKTSYENHINKYRYYNSQTSLPETYTYTSTGYWTPRPNQQATVDSFKRAVQAGRTNLLMYAVMRFGKSFTSLCCAKEMGAKLVLIVSAKADVREEWKKTVQQADNFNQDYQFVSSDELSRNAEIIQDTLATGRGVVAFLTLQDLQGDDIKEKHRELFQNQIDLLIVDETHYGARAEKYGQVLQDSSYTRDVKEKYADEDFVDIADATQTLKSLDTKITLHLSGTPYRILMGSEFEKEDIIAFYQFTDIVNDQEDWDAEHILNDTVKEWDNPYYGFPQMIRFAFNPSKAAQAKLQALKSNGITYAFSALFKPKSVRRASDDSHKEFIHQEEVLDLFMVIDGSKDDEELLGFINYDKIKEGNMCRHIVCVLPYCASCDALEKLLTDHAHQFINLQDYTIINISGVDRAIEYKSINAVKDKIKQCEENHQKTITLTVNRMLTGSTVEQWDTMLFLKDTASPQEYDQAIFRLQNQYIRRYISEDGTAIKYNMKPQTLLVDFSPHRMFAMQEQKSMIYNANTDGSGNQKLEERMGEELRISPIISMNKNKIIEVSPSDILDAISAYSSESSVIDETRVLPVDFSLFDIPAIRTTISAQAELGSRNGLQLEGHKSDNGQSDFDTPEDNQQQNNPGDQNSDSPNQTPSGNDANSPDDEATERAKLESKFRTYYSRILFYSFLSDDNLKSLDDILDSLDSPNNSRIARNLNLEKPVLIAIRTHINLFILSQLDYKIQNISMLSQDGSIDPKDRAIRAVRQFGKLSDSEVTTPLYIASDMISGLADDCLKRLADDKTAILDIASKLGEFTIAIVNRLQSLSIDIHSVKSSIWAIPTSSVAYEFTRKIYTVLGLDIDCIASKFTTYDLINLTVPDEDEIDYQKIAKLLKQNKKLSEISLDDEVGEEEIMKFEAVVGNPPYQAKDGGAQASAKPIYHNFVEVTKQLNPRKFTMIMPSRWYAGGKGLDQFRATMLDDTHVEALDDFLHPEEIFPDTNNRGGICYFLWNADYNNLISNVTVNTHTENGEIHSALRSMKTKDLEIFVRDSIGVSILDKVIPDDKVAVMSSCVSPRKPFGIESNIIKTERWSTSQTAFDHPVKCYGKSRQVGYISNTEKILHPDWINAWKLCTPRANNIGTELSDDNLNSFISEPDSICTEAYILVGAEMNLDYTSACNISIYFQTKFARFLHGIAKASQDASRKTYQFVPLQDFSPSSDIDWNQPISNIDAQLYTKYHLSPQEIEHIEGKIKPMKD